MFIKAKPNQFLVIGRKGKVVNRGAAASAFLWPGTSWVLISSTQQEATFEMTQETRDGIPLRFKGIAIYRVVRPEAAARLFDFSDGGGHHEIRTMIGHVCLGELRAVAAHMTMNECIEQRKTTLTDTVAAALQETIRGGGEGGDWGIEIDVVQVAQVFIVDADLRRQLEAEVRAQIKSDSEIAELKVAAELDQARAEAEKRKLAEVLETDKERNRVEKERLALRTAMERERLQAEAEVQRQRTQQENTDRLERIELDAEASRKHRAYQSKIDSEQLQAEHERQRLEAEFEAERIRQDHQRRCEVQELEQERIEAEAPVRLLELSKRMEMLKEELEVRRLEVQVRELEVACDMLRERAQAELRKELLPLEQVPAVAQAVGQMFQGANLSIYGENSPMLTAFTPALSMISEALTRRPVARNGEAKLAN